MATLVYGVVVNASTQQIITSATVSCPGQAVNNSQGSYTCSVNQDGTHTFTASAPGFQSQAQAVTCGGGLVNQNFMLSPS